VDLEGLKDSKGLDDIEIKIFRVIKSWKGIRWFYRDSVDLEGLTYLEGINIQRC